MLDLITQIVSLAAVDAINPCTIAVQVLLLGALVATKGRRDALVGGLLFSLTIYVMYFLYGLGILKILLLSGLQNLFLITLMVLLGVMIILEFIGYFFYRPGMRSMEMPMKLRPIAQRFLKSVENPLLAVPVAFLCSVLLLPCSSGPYLSALLRLASEQIGRISILLFYNLIFISPMLLITFLVSYGVSPERIKKWRDTHVRELHLISGILLLIVFVYMLVTIL